MIPYLSFISCLPSLGVFNFFLESSGFAPLAWLSKPDLALISLIIVDIWFLFIGLTSVKFID